jgi:hypothetical protein
VVLFPVLRIAAIFLDRVAFTGLQLAAGVTLPDWVMRGNAIGSQCGNSVSNSASGNAVDDTTDPPRRSNDFARIVKLDF